MRVRCKTTTWEPGTIYPPGQEPKPVTYEGDIACGFSDDEWGDVFVIWDAAAKCFRKVPIDECVLVEETTATARAGGKPAIWGE